jgi:hypothetical protein
VRYDDLAADFVSAELIRRLELLHGPDDLFEGILTLWSGSDPIIKGRLCHAAGLSTCHRARMFLERVKNSPVEDKYVRYLAALALDGPPQ